MNILEELKKVDRIVYNDKWLYWDIITQMWTVREHKYGKKKTPVICAVSDVDFMNALQVLLDDNL